MSDLRWSDASTGEDRRDLEERIRRVLDREGRGVVTVFDEEGVIDFANRVRVDEVRHAHLRYAQELAAYEGDPGPAA